jgi:hypothetical protein
VISVVIAVDVMDRSIDCLEGLSDLVLQPKVRVPVDIGNTVAQIDDEVGSGVIGETGKLGHQVEGGVTAFGCGRFAVVDVGDDCDTYGHVEIPGLIGGPDKRRWRTGGAFLLS